MFYYIRKCFIRALRNYFKEQLHNSLMISKLGNLIGGATATATVTPEGDSTELLDAKIEENERVKPTASPRPEKEKSSKSNGGNVL